MHDQLGIAHMDYKPDNIVFDEFGNPQIIDVNDAVVIDGQLLPQAEYISKGTAEYRPPEMFAAPGAGAPICPVKADLYSLAATIVALHTGRFLFPEGRTTQADAIAKNEALV